MNYHYSPAHHSLSKEIKIIFLLLILYIGSIADRGFFILLSLSFLELIGLLIYIEVIIISLCHMNKNVASEIEKREKIEIDIVKQNLILNDSQFDEEKSEKYYE